LKDDYTVPLEKWLEFESIDQRKDYLSVKMTEDDMSRGHQPPKSPLKKLSNIKPEETHVNGAAILQVKSVKIDQQTPNNEEATTEVNNTQDMSAHDNGEIVR
jgi:hypothetical protein